MATVSLAVALSGVCWWSINAVQKIRTREALRSDSSETVGEVKRLWSPGRSSTLWVGYTFTVNETSFKGETQVPEQLENSLRESGSLPIRYLPSDPEVNHPSAWEESTISAWLSLIFPDLLLFVLAAFGMMLFAQIRMDRRLVAEGMPALAVITKCSPAKGRSGISIKYEFRTVDDRVVSGISGYDSLQEIGASICVLYLLRDPKLNRPYQLLNCRVAQ
jgi:hypothetical protein